MMKSEAFPGREQTTYEHLASLGFSESEARRLISLKLHLPKQGEYREKILAQNRLYFVRWLVEHKRLSEDFS